MKIDYLKNKKTYDSLGLGKLTPSSKSGAFFRKNPVLKQFFKNTGRFESFLGRKEKLTQKYRQRKEE